MSRVQKLKFIYFVRPIGRTGPIKIGCSRYPANRLRELTVWSPVPLEVIAAVPGTHDDERFLHDCFMDRHSHCEWFHASPELLAAVNRIKATGSVDAIRGIFREHGNLRITRRSARAAQLARASA